MKTGTPPRLDGRTIDWAGLEMQPADDPPEPFSTLTHRIEIPQISCGITRTTPATHEIIRANVHRSPMYSGQIQSRGPRYCPSIEDKIVRFGDREIVLEGLRLNFWADISHRCMTASWPGFIAGAALVFLAFNAVFAFFYWIGDQPVSTSGAWAGDDSYKAIVRFTETPFAVTLTLRFANGQLVLDSEQNPSRGPAKQPTLTSASKTN